MSKTDFQLSDIRHKLHNIELKLGSGSGSGAAPTDRGLETPALPLGWLVLGLAVLFPTFLEYGVLAMLAQAALLGLLFFGVRALWRLVRGGSPKERPGTLAPWQVALREREMREREMRER